MPEATHFTLPIPLDVEPLLERLLGAQKVGLPFRARSHAAGDYVARLIRDAAARLPVAVAKAAPAKRAKPPEPTDDGESRTEQRIVHETVQMNLRRAALAAKRRAGR